MNYDYMEAMKEDIRDWMEESEFDWNAHGDKYECEDYLHDELWCEDSVTGNASGSYTFNSYKAKEYVMDNWDLLIDAIEEFGVSSREFGSQLKQGNWEWCDVTIRCNLLYQAIDELYEEYEEMKED